MASATIAAAAAAPGASWCCAQEQQPSAAGFCQMSGMAIGVPVAAAVSGVWGQPAGADARPDVCMHESQSPAADVATPPASPSLAAHTPTRRALSVAPAAEHAPALQAALCGASAVASAECPSSPTSPADLLSQCIHSFVHCVAGSPLIKSALLSVEVTAAHPPADAACADGAPAAGLEWTLAQLLALHLKAGCTRASESSLLASLWVLESANSADRSAATVCLDSYLKLLALFSEELVVRITADWPASFRRLRSLLVSAQADLLAALDWHVRLAFDGEVAPCYRWLFGGATALEGEGMAAVGAGWQAAVAQACASVRKQAALLMRPPPRPAPCAAEQQAASRPAKRCRPEPTCVRA